MQGLSGEQVVSGKRLAVIGAGPMGLYAAWAGARRGLEVTVFERDDVGHSLLSWGSARFFTPLSMNAPADALAALPKPPPGNALLTGPEMVEQVLLPLSRLPLLEGRILPRHAVIAIGRKGFTRGDFPGHPVRHERPFQILAETPEGERVFEADAVLDASGVYGLPTRLGPGGLPARGEITAAEGILRRLSEVESFAEGFRRGRALVIGHGHSAAHALLRLAESASLSREAKVTWAFRSRHLRPCLEIPSDPLPERARVVKAANALAKDPPAFLDIRRGVSILDLDRMGRRRETGDRLGAGGRYAESCRWRVGFSHGKVVRTGNDAHARGYGQARGEGNQGERSGEFEAVAAFTGYRPDLSFLSELALDLSPITEGAGPLRRVLAGVTDCLAVPKVSARDLGSGEPGFHLIGSKAYGRANTFLLREGLRQLESILQIVS